MLAYRHQKNQKGNPNIRIEFQKLEATTLKKQSASMALVC